MSVASLVGLVLLNGLVAVVGTCLLFGLRGFSSATELARLGGLSYLVGLAALGVVFTLELVVGIPFSLATILATAAALAGAGIALGRAAGRPWPLSSSPRPRLGLAGAAGAALVVVYLEALFRAGRLNALSAWDAWAFWVPKAKAIYYFGGLDEQFFRELPGATYPPIVPALEATAFHFMGSADVVTLHLQFWFFLAGFVAAVAGTLAPRVPELLLWPSLLLVLVAPRIVLRTLDPQADFLLDYFFVAAALLVALWLLEGERWQLVSGSLFLAAAMLTKREGQLFAACIVAAALAASWRERRRAWPRLLAAGAAAGALALPWRIWFTSRDLQGELPGIGLLGLLDHRERALPALRSVLSTLFDYDLWLIVPFLLAVAVVLAFLAGARLLASYVGLLTLLVVAGLTWVLWSFVELQLPFVQDESVNPIVRLSASLVLLSAAFLPLLLHPVLPGREMIQATALPRLLRATGARPAHSALLVTAAALAYPLATLAGGGPRFPSVSDCARPPTGNGEIEAVFGSFPSARRATPLRERALRAGFQGVVAERNACGRVEVVLRGIPSLAVGRDFVQEARAAGFQVRLERQG